ncbi:uncharacterized protein LOC122039855 [Zingiber officinale]|uniref:uncharacterized protein LOC122039855 n=1 Tax=Zingiber officinale TaxID=94328 RepID=UPI001C4C6888|nr:uncharacterized protein LOC122039855 [Zingiber officinale]
MDFGGSWEDHLHLVEFAYNNSYHSAIQMAPFEALYGRACRSPTLWDEVGESSVLGPQRIQRDAELVGTISYADRRRRPLEFSVGDHVFLRVSPTKGVRRFGLKGKLAPRYIGPFQILERIGEVAYRLALPPSLAGVHDVFHVSMLRKYVPHPTHILADVSITLQPDVAYEEAPVRILDRKERQLRNKTIRLVKVGWEHHSDDEATWELEDKIRARYPQLFDEVACCEGLGHNSQLLFFTRETSVAYREVFCHNLPLLLFIRDSLGKTPANTDVSSVKSSDLWIYNVGSIRVLVPAISPSDSKLSVGRLL